MQRLSFGRPAFPGVNARNHHPIFLILVVSMVLGFTGCGGGNPSGGSSSGPGDGGGSGGNPPTTSNSRHAPIRTRYLRTDLPYGQEVFPPHITAYDNVHKLFFVSNATSNRIDVFDAVNESQAGSIIIPSPWGLDLGPNETLYAATTFGDLYFIDPAQMKVIRRVQAATLGTAGYQASQVFALADGRLALLGAQQGLSIDGSTSFAIWDPATNDLKVNQPSSFTNISTFAVSGDRKRIAIASAFSDGHVELYDVDTGQQITKTYGLEYVWLVVPSPDGSRLFVFGDNEIVECDASSLLEIARLTPPDLAVGAVVSQDGSTLYVASFNINLFAFDTNGLLLKGWVAGNNVADDLQSFLTPGAVDETGLIAGPIGHGVAFVDGGEIHSGSPTLFNVGYLTPDTGPVTGGTPIEATADIVKGSLTTGMVYIGSGTVGDISISGPSVAGSSPPSTLAGAADFTVVAPDGSVALLPEAYSYGPTIVGVSTNAATADGGGQGVVFGYGFGQKPSDLNIAIGGRVAPITQLITTPAPYVPYPFPIEAAIFTFPPGTAGAAADVTLTTNSGSATASTAVQYVPALQHYSLPGSSLAQGVYSHSRGVVYYADRADIKVFSVTNRAWLEPIEIPFTDSKSHLWAVALSPDGSHLAVSDAGEANIYVLDPDVPQQVQSFHVQTPVWDDLEPCGLVVTDSGSVYFASYQTGGTGEPSFHKLDISTGVVSDLDSGELADVGGWQDAFMRVVMSPDGRYIYTNNSGNLYRLDTTDDTGFFGCQVSSGSGLDELAISADGGTLFSNSFVIDPNMNVLAPISYVDRDTWIPSAVFGLKVSRESDSLFQPLTDGLDLIDATTGIFYRRISLPVQISDAYDALTLDEDDDLLLIISNEGIDTLDLSGMPGASKKRERKAANKVSSHNTSGRGFYSKMSPGRFNNKSAVMKGFERAPHPQYRRGRIDVTKHRPAP